MFKILGQDGREYGPVGLDVVQRWIAEGRATAQTRVLPVGGAEWKTLGDLPEFTEALARSPRPPGLPPPAAAAPPGPVGEGREKGLAITSLVLGIVSLMGGVLLTGIPAIITGIMARNRVRREPARYGGDGLALTGLILGCVGVALTFLLALPAALLLPALAKAKARAQRITCVSNMKMIGLGARMFAADHHEVFPTNFLSMSNELPSPKILTCPADTTRLKMMSWADYSEANVSYEFLIPGGKTDDLERQPVFRCPIHNNVGYGDGSVQMESGVPGRPRPSRR
jgi:hypothetical protein